MTINDKLINCYNKLSNGISKIINSVFKNYKENLASRNKKNYDNDDINTKSLFLRVIYLVTIMQGHEPSQEQLKNILKFFNDFYSKKYDNEVEQSFRQKELQHNYNAFRNKNNKKLNYHLKFNQKPRNIYKHARSNC